MIIMATNDYIRFDSLQAKDIWMGLLTARANQEYSKVPWTWTRTHRQWKPQMSENRNTRTVVESCKTRVASSKSNNRRWKAKSHKENWQFGQYVESSILLKRLTWELLFLIKQTPFNRFYYIKQEEAIYFRYTSCVSLTRVHQKSDQIFPF